MLATIYSKPNCPHCQDAKALLKKRNIEYVELNAVDYLDDLVKLVESATGQRPKTVPQIWLDDDYIGGYTELASKLGNV